MHSATNPIKINVQQQKILWTGLRNEWYDKSKHL